MSGGAKGILPIAATVLGAYFGGPIGAEVMGGAFGAAAGTAVGSAIGGMAGQAIGSKLAGTDKVPNIPTPNMPAQPVMPTPDSQAVQQQQSRSIAEQISRRGRASTILTQGGLDAVGTKLGA